MDRDRDDGASSRRAARAAPARRAGGYLAAAAFVAAANIIAYLAGAHLSGANLAMLFLLSVLATGAGFGLGPALAAALLAGVTYNVLHLEPRYTIWIASPGDLFTFSVFFAVAIATGWLAGRARDRAQRAAERAEALAVLLEASRALSAASTPDEAAQALAAQIGAATGRAAIVLSPAENDLRLAAAPGGLDSLSAETRAAARRVWDSETPASGQPTSDWDFRTLEGLHRRVGVVGLRQAAGSGPAGPLLESLLRQGAVAVERAELASAAAENRALREADALRSALLNSISHDFRTPLSTVLGSATTLLDYEAQLPPTVRRDLLKSIQEDAERLNRQIGALLDMARLEAGALKPRTDWVDVREVIASALRRAPDRLAGRVRRAFDTKVSLVKADPVLLEQAVLNLFENVAAHTPADAAVEVAVFEDQDQVVIAVEDEGPGVPTAAQTGIFDKFQRGPPATGSAGGLGLGLSIARGFVEAMGGRVGLASPIRGDAGARFLLSLPKASRTPRGLL